MKIELGGHTLQLLPDRAVYWPEQRAILVADVHLGKDQVFRRQGLAAPAGVLDQDLSRLSRLLEHSQAERLIILGDWVHAPPIEEEHWPEAIARWRASHAGISIDLVLGNHDRRLAPWLDHWQITGHSGQLQIEGLNLVHEWSVGLKAPGLSGHLHPGARLRSRREKLMLPAFLVSEDHLVAPAFGRFTGLMEADSFPWIERYVTTGKQIYRLPENMV